LRWSWLAKRTKRRDMWVKALDTPAKDTLWEVIRENEYCQLIKHKASSILPPWAARMPLPASVLPMQQPYRIVLKVFQSIELNPLFNNFLILLLFIAFRTRVGKRLRSRVQRKRSSKTGCSSNRIYSTLSLRVLTKRKKVCQYAHPPFLL